MRSARILMYAVCLWCLSFAACKTQKQSVRDAPATATEQRLGKKQMKRLVGFASSQLNAPYRWGGSTPKGFDCSGFTTYCFRHFGVQLPRTAADQAQSGKRIRSKKARPGDLIFFKGPDHKQKKTAHVGIVVSGKRKNIRFIHAASKGITISGLSEEYFSKRFTTIRRVRG